MSPRSLLCSRVHIPHKNPTDQYKYHILHAYALVREIFAKSRNITSQAGHPDPKNPLKPLIRDLSHRLRGLGIAPSGAHQRIAEHPGRRF